MKHSPTRCTQRGFTLVEMLVVLAILVLLVSMVMPRILGSQKKADINAARTQIGMFQAALERYAIDCKGFPTTEQGLAALVEKPADLDENVKWDGPYVTGEIGKDPWGNEYQYECDGDTPKIWSFGPDRQDNTEDDICSWTSGSGAGEAGAEKQSPAETRRDTRTETRRETTAAKRPSSREPSSAPSRTPSRTTPRSEKKPGPL